jgi:hypothetical protein
MNQAKPKAKEFDPHIAQRDMPRLYEHIDRVDLWIMAAKYQHQKDASDFRIVCDALKFYSKGKHFEYVGKSDNEPETVSGEPSNIECGGCDDCSFTLENGGIARAALKEVGVLE